MRFAMVVILMFGILSCGVKGDPIPPASPPELGRGEPTYKRATEEFAFPDVPSIHDNSDNEQQKQ